MERPEGLYAGTRMALAYARHHGQTYRTDEGVIWSPEEAAARIGLDISEVPCPCGEEEARGGLD